MRNASFSALPRLLIGRRGGALFVVILLGLAPVTGCGRERRQITPTTLGTDLSKLPRGQMKPYPWPGQSIVQAPAHVVDPSAAMASGEAPPR